MNKYTIDRQLLIDCIFGLVLLRAYIGKEKGRENLDSQMVKNLSDKDIDLENQLNQLNEILIKEELS